MNRYVLFFLTCISLHAHIAISNSTLEEARENVMREFFEKNFNHAINEKCYKNALPLKDICHDYLLGHFERLSYNDEQAIQKDIEKEGKFCIAHFARAKKECEYKQKTERNVFIRFLLAIPAYDPTIQKELGQKAYEEVLDKFRQGISGNLSYLFVDPIEQDVLIYLMIFLERDVPFTWSDVTLMRFKQMSGL